MYFGCKNRDTDLFFKTRFLLSVVDLKEVIMYQVTL